MRKACVPVIRSTARFALHVLAAGVAAAAIIFAVVAWRLSGGPISLAFLTPYVQDALRQSDSPYQVQFSDTILTWAGWERALDIRLVDVRAIGADGAVAGRAPEVSVGLSLPALWRGLIAPTSLEIIEPTVRVVRGADGALELGLGDESGAVGSSVELLLADLLAPPDPSRAMGYLRRVGIIQGDLTLIDRRLGMSWRAPRATVILSRDGAGISATASLAIEVAGATTAEFEARARYSGGDGLHVRVDFADVRPEWFAPNVPALAPLAAARFPVGGSLDVSFGAGLAPDRVAFDLRAGAGAVALGEWLGLEFDIAAAGVRGVFSPHDERLRIDDATIDLGGPTVTIHGVIEGFDGAPFIAAGATIVDLPVDDLGRYWPRDLAANTRAWIVANLTGGIIRKSETAVRIEPGDLEGDRLPDEAIRTTLELEGVTVNYLNPLPKVSGVNAFGIVTGRRLEMRTWDGRLHGLSVDEASITIDDIWGAGIATIDVTVSGPIRDALEVLAHPFLGYPQKLGIDPEIVGGTASTNLHFTFPLLEDLTLDEVVVTADSTLSDVNVEGAFDGFDVSGGPLSLALDGKGIDLAGPVVLNGVPADGAWRENFGDDAPFRSRFMLSGRFTDAQRRVLDMPGQAYVAGPADIDVEIIDLLDGRRRWRISADLRDAVVRVPEIRWSKPAGVDGIAQFDAVRAPGKPLVVESVEVAAGDLVARGRAEFDAESGAMRRLDLSRLTFGETDVRATVVALGDGGYAVVLDGASLDARPYLENDYGDETLATLSLTARLDRVITRDGETLGGVEAALRLVGGRWEQMRVNGVLNGGEPLSMRIGPTKAGRMFWMTSDDAGSVLRALGIFDNAVEGQLVLVANLDTGAADGAIEGKLRVDDFKVRNAPLLTKILSLASLTGIFDLLKGEGLPFTRLTVPFTKVGDTIHIREAHAYGPALGFTFEGRIDLAADTADLKGTVVPAYTINSVLGRIPLIGDILVGPKGGGVFAVTYSVKGPLDDPDIAVNPLAALAPGVLRGLFIFDAERLSSENPFGESALDDTR